MNDKSSESFEEYCKKNNRDYSCQSSWEEKIFNDQQKKIDELEARLDTKFKTPPIVFALEEKLQAAEEKIEELQEQSVADVAIREKLLHENEVLRGAVEFYTHEKPVERYGDGSVMKNHSWDIACCACTEKPVGQKARQALEKVSKK